MKKFLAIILFLIGFVIIGNNHNLLNDLGIDFPSLTLNEEDKIGRFIGVMFCVLSIVFFRRIRAGKIKKEQERLRIENEKYNNWYNSLSEDERFEADAIKMTSEEKAEKDFKYFLRNDNNRQDVNDCFKELSSVLKNGISFSDKVFNGIDSLGDLLSDIVTKDNERFSGMVYFTKSDLEFNVKELIWLRNFDDGIVNGLSAKYRYNQLVEKIFYEKGNIKKIENFDRTEDLLVYLSSTTEYESNHEFTKTIYGTSGEYKIEVYKNNKPHGDWLEFNIFDIYNTNRYLASRKSYNEGLENGKWEWYNQDGVIIMTQYWKDGSDSFLKDEMEKLNVGMAYSSIIDILGEPDFNKNAISNGKSKRKIFYGKSINRLGNDAYAFEISFVDDKLSGFKELA